MQNLNKSLRYTGAYQISTDCVQTLYTPPPWKTVTTEWRKEDSNIVKGLNDDYI